MKHERKEEAGVARATQGGADDAAQAPGDRTCHRVPSAGVAFWNLGDEAVGACYDVNPYAPLTWAAVGANA